MLYHYSTLRPAPHFHASMRPSVYFSVPLTKLSLLLILCSQPSTRFRTHAAVRTYTKDMNIRVHPPRPNPSQARVIVKQFKTLSQFEVYRIREMVTRTQGTSRLRLEPQMSSQDHATTTLSFCQVSLWRGAVPFMAWTIVHINVSPRRGPSTMAAASYRKLFIPVS